jgi:predicted nucleotide-binding protein
VKTELERYLGSLSEFRGNTRNNRWLVVHFGYFLTEILGESISPANLRRCYEAVSLSAPRNISDVVSKSRAFVKTKQGLRLHHDVMLEIAAELSGPSKSDDATPEASTSTRTSDKAHNVVVVYGRDEAVRTSMFQFLRALKLNPIEWSEAVRGTGHGSPYVGQVLDSLFDLAQVVIVLFTPDENARLKDVLRNAEDDDVTLNQPRPNVLIESGMALARNEAHTIIVQVGRIRTISDLSGRHVIRLNNSAEKRLDLAHRLQTAGCPVSTAGKDWLNVGDFSAS